MFSRHKSPLLFLFMVLLTGSLVACGLKIGDQKVVSKLINLNQVSCLKGVGKKISRYFQADLSYSDTDEVFSCLISALDLFEQRVEGEGKDYYSPQEIRSFLLENYIKDRDITDGFLDAAMRLKVSLVGGSRYQIQRSEYRGLVSVLRSLRIEALALQPHMPILNVAIGQHSEVLPPSEMAMARALRQLEVSGERVGQVFISKNSAFYNLDDLEKLVREVRTFVYWNEDIGSSDVAHKWSEFVRVFKSITVSATESYVLPNEWPVLFVSGSLWYGVWLRFNYQVRHSKIFLGEGLSGFISLGNRVIAGTKAAISRQVSGHISYRQIFRVLDIAEKSGWLKEGVSHETLVDTVPRLLSKLFGDRSLKPSERFTEADSEISSGLTLEMLGVASNEFKQWSGRQARLSQFAVLAEYQSKDPRAGTFLDDGSLLEWLSHIRLDGFLEEVRGERNSSFKDLLSFTDTLQPLFPLEDPYPFIVYNTVRRREIVPNNFYDLSVKNAFYSMVRLVISAYSEDPERGRDGLGLVEPEVISLFEDIRPLIEELKILHPRASSVGEKRFLEGNLFTYSGNGVNAPDPKSPAAHLFSPAEGVELITYMYSNASLSDSVMDRMLEVCGQGEADVFGIPRVERKCFRKKYRKAVAKNFHNAPGMAKYLREMDGGYDGWGKFMDILFDGTEKWDDVTPPGEEPRWVQFTQVATMTMILHYVETMMTKYDQDEDGFLTTEEADKAFPRFYGLIDKILKNRGMDEEYEDVRDIFMYILSYKDVPSTDLWRWPLTGGRYLLGKVDWWGINLDRKGLLEAFAVIVSRGQEVQPGRKQ